MIASITQFGVVGRLTPRAGGKKATTTVDYYADTGALKSVQVAGTGADSTALTEAINAQLVKKPKPTELDALKAEKERLDTMAGICASSVKLTSKPPEYCSQ